VESTIHRDSCMIGCMISCDIRITIMRMLFWNNLIPTATFGYPWDHSRKSLFNKVYKRISVTRRAIQSRTTRDVCAITTLDLCATTHLSKPWRAFWVTNNS
jgi:hypothetical protein